MNEIVKYSVMNLVNYKTYYMPDTTQEPVEGESTTHIHTYAESILYYSSLRLWEAATHLAIL